jgi:tetratricopeptide (TPR) repeat protein
MMAKGNPRKIFVACAGLLLLVYASGFALQQQSAPKHQIAPAAVGNARFRADIKAVKELLPKLPDRGAAHFFLAWLYAHLGDYRKSLSFLKQCPLEEGFDPDGAWEVCTLKKSFGLHKQAKSRTS